MWIISYIWNDKTYNETYGSHSTAICRFYDLRKQGKDPSFHEKV